MKPLISVQSMQPRKVESVLDEIKNMEDRVAQRAYQIFLNRGEIHGFDLDDWMTAKQELSWTPAVEVWEKGSECVIRVALPGVNPEQIDMRITPEELLIKAATHHGHAGKEGKVHLCEFCPGELFRCVRFPTKVNPDRVNVEYSNGLLSLRAEIVKEEEAQKLQLAAAS